MSGRPRAKVVAITGGSAGGRPPQLSDTSTSPSAVARYVVPRLLAGGSAIYAFLVVCGLLLTGVFDQGWLARDDRHVSRWFVGERTPTLNSWTHLGSSFSNTSTAIALTVLLIAGLRLWLRRWRESPQ